MSFKELRGLSETPDQKKKAAEGFESRLREHEKRFQNEERRLSPTANFYERRYGR